MKRGGLRTDALVSAGKNVVTVRSDASLTALGPRGWYMWFVEIPGSERLVMSGEGVLAKCDPDSSPAQSSWPNICYQESGCL